MDWQRTTRYAINILLGAGLGLGVWAGGAAPARAEGDSSAPVWRKSLKADPAKPKADPAKPKADPAKPKADPAKPKTVAAAPEISLLAPAADSGEPCIDMIITRQPLETAVSILANAAKKSILLGDGLKGQMVTAFFKNTPVSQALKSFADAQQICIVERGDCLLLVSRSEYLNNYAKTEVVPIKHANPEALSKVIMSYSKAELLSITPDPRTHSLVLKGDPEQIGICREAALKLDRSLTSEVFTIRYTSVANIAKAIRDSLMISEASLGSVVTDERSNRLIVSEIPENMAVCREVIKNLDVPVETRVFSTGKIDPKVVAEQIQKGELGAKDAKDKRPSSADASVQVFEGTNQIIVTDTPERLKILEKIMSEMNSNIETRVIQPRHATPKDIAEILKTSFPNIASAIDPRTGMLVVTADRDRIQQVQDLVEKLDAKENTQVEIEAKIMLVGSSKLKSYGVRIFGQNPDGLDESLTNLSINPNLAADSPKKIGATMGSPFDSPLKNPVKTSDNYLEVLQPQLQVQAVVRAIESDGDTKVLSNPRLRMLAGQSSTIFSGSKEPYNETTFQDTRSIESVKFIDVGVTFGVTPYVSPENAIVLDINTDFSTLREIRNGIPVVDTRRAQSIVESRDGETILLGGLISEDSGRSHAGLPILGSIPGLGALFSGKSRHNSEQELLIVITSNILARDPLRKATPATLSRGYEGIQREFNPPPPPVPANLDSLGKTGQKTALEMKAQRPGEQAR